jgi:hypothetical protein
MPEASSSIDPSTGTSPTAETRADIWQLSASEASALLEERARDFHQPAPLVPSNAREADARLATLINDATWARKLMAGDVETRREFETLTALKAAGEGPDAVADPAPQVIETTVGAEGLRRQDLLSAAADLRKLWSDSDNCEAAIASVLDPNATVDADLLQNMQEWKEQALRDPVFVEMFMRGDLWATQRMTLANAVIAIGTGEVL